MVSQLHRHLSMWTEFVDRNWLDWDISEYDHDIGCRMWIQVALENSAPETALKICTVTRPPDDAFKRRMVPVRRLSSYHVPVLRWHPYFWETHTLHPEL